MSYKTTLTIIWGYIVEIIGAGVLYGIAVHFVGVSPLTKFMQDTADEWNDLSGLLFSAALAIWLTFINIRGSLFGDYLARIRGDAVYSSAFLTAMVAYFLTTVAVITCKGIKHDAASHVAFFLLLYSGINLISMVKNATELVKFYSGFKRGLEVERIKLERERIQNAGSAR